MIIKILTAFSLCFSLHAASQMPVLNWAKAFKDNNLFGSMANSNSRTVGVDHLGNVYTAGLFEKTVDFDPGPNVYPLVSTGFGMNIFISKLDANGNFIWAKQIPTYVEFGRMNLKIDGSGNIYLASDLNKPADMDPGPGVYMMKPTGFRDAFILKLDTDGNFIWAKQIGGPGDTGPQADMIELDQNNNIIIAGIFNNTVDFDPGPGVFNITSSAHMQTFIVKLTNNGEFIWAKQFGNGKEAHAWSHISDLKYDRQGNIVCTGFFGRTVDFDPGPNVHSATSSLGSAGDGFICKLDADLNFIWVKTLGQVDGAINHYLTPTGLDIDGNNNIITTGFFTGNFDFDPDAGTQVINGDMIDCYILKLDQQGKLIWVKTIGGNGQDTGYDVVVDAENNVYTIGSFGPSVDFDPGPGTHIINSPYYGPSALVKLSSNGDFIYAAPFQSLNYGTSYFSRMEIDPAKSIYITGSVSGENDFDPGPNVYSLSGTSDKSPFVLKLSPCLGITRSQLNISSCSSYKLNNQTYSVSGTYYQTIPNTSGCDSVITLHLIINKKFTEQTKEICEGEVFFAAGHNQATSGIYYDTLSTTLGCDSVVLTRLIVNPRPKPNLGIDKSLCKNTQITLSPGLFTSYLWHDNSTGATAVASTAGLHWVEVTNEYNCSGRDSFNVIRVIDPPANFLKETDSICSYENLELASEKNFKSYLWSTGASTKSIQVQSTGIYWMEAINEHGCSGIDTIKVIQKQCMSGVYIPTAFTPNNDGKNDYFKPTVYGNLLRYRLVVYNRWGNVVFETNDPKKGWDGKVKNMLQDTGAFVWICDYELQGTERKVEKGSLLLLR